MSEKKVRGKVGITRFRSLCFTLESMGWLPLDDLACLVGVEERTIRKYCKMLRIEIQNGKADFNTHIVEVS